MKRSFYLFFLFLIFTISSCKPVASEVNENYVGLWEGYGNGGYHEINISSSGHATYQGITGVTTVTSSGKARVKGDIFKVGLKKFTLGQEPMADTSGIWTMVVDGVTYYRY